MIDEKVCVTFFLFLPRLSTELSAADTKLDVENTLKLYSGPTILLGLAGRRPALAWSFKKISKRLKRLKALQTKHLPAMMWSLW